MSGMNSDLNPITGKCECVHCLTLMKDNAFILQSCDPELFYDLSNSAHHVLMFFYHTCRSDGTFGPKDVNPPPDMIEPILELLAFSMMELLPDDDASGALFRFPNYGIDSAGVTYKTGSEHLN